MPSISISSAKDRFAAIEKSKKKALTDEEERAMKVSEKKRLALKHYALLKKLLVKNFSVDEADHSVSGSQR